MQTQHQRHMLRVMYWYVREEPLVKFVIFVLVSFFFLASFVECHTLSVNIGKANGGTDVK